MAAEPLRPLADLFAWARTIIEDARRGQPPPPFEELADAAAAAVLVAMALWQVARDLDLRGTAAALAGAIRGLAEEAEHDATAFDIDAALAALEALLSRAGVRTGAAA